MCFAGRRNVKRHSCEPRPTDKSSPFLNAGGTGRGFNNGQIFRGDSRRQFDPSGITGRYQHFFDNVIHRCGEPDVSGSRRHTLCRRLCRHSSSDGNRHSHHGAVGPLAGGGCPRHGAECLFRLWACPWTGFQLATGAGSRVRCFRIVSSVFPVAVAQLADWGHSHQPAPWHYRWYWPVPCHDRPARHGPCCR